MTKNDTKAIQAYDYGQNAGVGFENTTNADFSISFLNLLQALSPEVQESGEKRIEGAKAGMFVDSATQQLVDGKKGIALVPCDTQHVYVEWVPRDNGGGFVGVHELGSDTVKKALGENKAAFGKLKLPNGNDLVETFYLFCLTLENEKSVTPSGYTVLGFTSTKIKKYRKIMNQLRSFSSKTPIFAHRLHLSSTPDKNKKGQPFFNVELRPLFGDVPSSLIPPELDGALHPLLAAGKSLMESVRGGQAKVDRTNGEGQGAPVEEEADEVFGR